MGRWRQGRGNGEVGGKGKEVMMGRQGVVGREITMWKGHGEMETGRC